MTLLLLLDGLPPATASAAITEGNDTPAATAAVAVSAAVATTEAADTLLATVGDAVAATLAVTEASDALLATVGDVIAATLSATDSDDALNGAASVSGINTSLAAIEADDALSATALGPAGQAGIASGGGGRGRTRYYWTAGLRVVEQDDRVEATARVDAISDDELLAILLAEAA